MARKIGLEIAGMAQGMKDCGVAVQEIADAVGLSTNTVNNIIHNRGRWSDLYKDQGVFAKYRQLIKMRMNSKALTYADRMLDSIDAARDTGNVSQRAVAYGILRQHERLDAGEATSHVAVIHKTDLEALDRLARRLADGLVAGTKTEG